MGYICFSLDCFHFEYLFFTLSGERFLDRSSENYSLCIQKSYMFSEIFMKNNWYPENSNIYEHPQTPSSSSFLFFFFFVILFNFLRIKQRRRLLFMDDLLAILRNFIYGWSKGEKNKKMSITKRADRRHVINYLYSLWCIYYLLFSDTDRYRYL